MTYIYDIDDTLLLYPDTEKEPQNRGGIERYGNEVPNIKEINKLNNLYKNNIIIIYTGRGYNQYDLTVKQLKKYKIKYHELIMGRPLGIFIDRDCKTTML